MLALSFEKMFQSTPNLISWENATLSGMSSNAAMFQSTPNLISWENTTEPPALASAESFQSTPNLISWENANPVDMQIIGMVSIHSQPN